MRCRIILSLSAHMLNVLIVLILQWGLRVGVEGKIIGRVRNRKQMTGRFQIVKMQKCIMRKSRVTDSGSEGKKMATHLENDTYGK